MACGSCGAGSVVAGTGTNVQAILRVADRQAGGSSHNQGHNQGQGQNWNPGVTKLLMDAGRPWAAPDVEQITAQVRAEAARRKTWSLTQLQQQRTNAVMCGLCPKVREGRTRCAASGETIRAILGQDVGQDGQIAKRPCPLGRHARGSRVLVTWLGTLWLGVPEPLRWWHDWLRMTRFGRGAAVLAGCGCNLAFKLAWKRAAEPGSRPGSKFGAKLGAKFGLMKSIGHALESVPKLRARHLPRAASWWNMVRQDVRSRRGHLYNDKKAS
jgi:hypothetical protein